MKLTLLVLALGVALCQASIPSGKLLMTYNAYSYVKDERVARRNALIDSLNMLDADLVCLQEMWFESDVKAVLEGVNATYPYSWSFIHTEEGQYDPVLESPISTCQLDQLLEFGECLLRECIGVSDVDGLVECGLGICNPLLIIDERCIECAITSCVQYFPDFGDILGCIANSSRDSNLRCQSWLSEDPSKTRGLLMLSQHPMSDLDRVRYYPQPSFLDRGYLKANVHDIGTVVCTHLTAIFSSIPYIDVLTDFSSYQEQNLFELQELLTTFSGNPDVIIMGDFNTGPDIDEFGITAEYGENFETIQKSDFVSLNLKNGECTYCEGNPLVKVTAGDEIIDHVLVPSQSEDRCSFTKVLFHGEIVPVDNETNIPLSDHYAVAAVLGPLSADP